jgi:hypothetical protein
METLRRMKLFLTLTLLCLAGALACNSFQAPSNLTYATPTALYPVGQAIQENRPSFKGGAEMSFRVSPDLPGGLSLDPQTGILSGTPTTITAMASYVVTASNSSGQATATLTLTVTGLNYAFSTAVYDQGVLIFPNGPTSSPASTTYSVSPGLPGGLSLDPASGATTGTPAAVAATATYLVTASSPGGVSTVSLDLTVQDPASAPGAWGAAPGLATARTLATATLLLDGTVLVAGGTGDNARISTPSPLASVEVYSAGVWDPSKPPMGTARARNTATLLPSGTVLVTGGGSTAKGNPTAAVEIYRP